MVITLRDTAQDRYIELVPTGDGRVASATMVYPDGDRVSLDSWVEENFQSAVYHHINHLEFRFSPPQTIDVLDQNGGFTALFHHRPGSKAYYEEGGYEYTVWRPGKVLRGNTTGTLISYDEHSFFQRNNNCTQANYKCKGYRYPVVLWFDNSTGERVA